MEECFVQVKRVMAALDLSAYSEITFMHAHTLAKCMGAELVLLNVINSRGLEHIDQLAAQGYNVSRERYLKEVESERRAELERDYLSRVGEVPTRLIFRVGLPVAEILKAVKEEQADYLVIGPKGRSNLENVLLGHVVEKVFRRCPCPVVSVRGPEHCAIPG